MIQYKYPMDIVELLEDILIIFLVITIHRLRKRRKYIQETLLYQILMITYIGKIVATQRHLKNWMQS